MSTELFLNNGCCTVARLHSCYLAMGLHVTVFKHLHLPKNDRGFVWVFFVTSRGKWKDESYGYATLALSISHHKAAKPLRKEITFG
jgi:hypothetical protein